MNQEAEVKGGCHCGQIRYNVTSTPGFHFYCQCTDCQKISGGAYLGYLAVAEDALAMDGNAKCYSRTSGTGGAVHTYFCPECGSPLYAQIEGNSNIVLIVSSLDDTSVFKPQRVMFGDSAPEWDHKTL